MLGTRTGLKENRRPHPKQEPVQKAKPMSETPIAIVVTPAEDEAIAAGLDPSVGRPVVPDLVPAALLVAAEGVERAVGVGLGLPVLVPHITATARAHRDRVRAHPND